MVVLAIAEKVDVPPVNVVPSAKAMLVAGNAVVVMAVVLLLSNTKANSLSPVLMLASSMAMVTLMETCSASDDEGVSEDT